jgi:hypothetical protein
MFKNVVPVFLIIDAAKNENSAYFETVKKMIYELKEKLNEDENDFEARVSIMSLADTAYWIHEMVFPEEIAPEFLVEHGKSLNMEAAFDLLKGSLNTAYMRCFIGDDYQRYRFPIIVFVTNHLPIDYVSGERPFGGSLDVLKNSGWFTWAQRHFVVYGNEGFNEETEVFAAVTGTMKSVYRIADLDTMKETIQTVIMTAINYRERVRLLNEEDKRSPWEKSIERIEAVEEFAMYKMTEFSDDDFLGILGLEDEIWGDI